MRSKLDDTVDHKNPIILADRSRWADFSATNQFAEQRGEASRSCLGTTTEFIP